MAGEMKIDKSPNWVETGSKSDFFPNLAEQCTASRNDGNSSSASPSVDATSSIKGEADQEPVTIGYDGAYSDWDEHDYYNERDSYFPSPEYLETHISYGSEAAPYSNDTTLVADVPNGTTVVSNETVSVVAAPEPNASTSDSAASVNSKGLTSVKSNGAVDARLSSLPSCSNSSLSLPSSNFSKSTLQSQPAKPLTKASGNDRNPSSAFPSVDATSSIKGETDQEPVREQGLYYPPTSCYDYCGPGYDGAYSEWDEHDYYNERDGLGVPYTDVDGPCVGQHSYFPSPGYLQTHVSYESEAVLYSNDSTLVEDAPNRTVSIAADPKPNASASDSAASVNSKGLTSVKTNGTVNARVSSALPSGSNSSLSLPSSNFSKSTLQSQPAKPLTKVPQFGSDFRSAGLSKGYYPMEKISSSANQGKQLFPYNGSMNYRPNDQTMAGNERCTLKEEFSSKGNFEASSELKRGPRAFRGTDDPLSSSTEKDQLGFTIRRDKYNLQEFQTNYENAKFFVIKSYSEDDIHKSIKYNVWASTPNGNMKLEAAFHDAETISKEKGTRCPIFLFFSVNESGQFLGLAEMIGKVDFKKDMDFWERDKWNGFFPVKWHIIKDIPSNQLRHIILENNDNKPVTRSRDTQEIRLKQGSEMLTIFKSYPLSTSILDDFNFYEGRKNSLQAKRRNNSVAPLQMETYRNNDIPNLFQAKRSNTPAAYLQVETYKNNDTPTSLQTKRINKPAASLQAQTCRNNDIPKRSEAGPTKVKTVPERAKEDPDPKAAILALTRNLYLNSHSRKPVQTCAKYSLKDKKPYFSAANS